MIASIEELKMKYPEYPEDMKSVQRFHTKQQKSALAFKGKSQNQQ